MRVTEKAVAIIILTFSAWAIVMWLATSFQGNEPNRILRVELGEDAAQLNQAVAGPDNDAIAHNIEMVVRNTYMDFVFILLYWLTFVGLAMLAGRMGKRVLGACAALLITGAAVNDLLENGAILTAMRVKPFTDAVAVDISEYSQWKWVFFFVASILLGLAIALNDRVSNVRRLSGGLFIASGVFGLLGIMRYRVSLEYSLWMIDIGILLIAAALILTLWKIYHSIREIDRVEHMDRVHAHA
ncbi:MAG TPA: hypothetical protein VFC15_07935 [Candidatus Limnocylindrales bacterium]|jgi:hypothetical protein|nr:hypothetical protein [Candidatus Limnocylindrales bacterium]